MARINSNLKIILNAIVARIVAQVEGATADSCYIAVDNGEITGSPSEFVFVVSPVSGEFDEGYLDGGAQEQATDFFQFSVTIYSTLQLDMVYRDTEALTNDTLGLIARHKDLLQALTAHDLLVSSDNVLRDPILPGGYQYDRNGRSQAFVRQTFKLAFDWDL